MSQPVGKTVLQCLRNMAVCILTYTSVLSQIYEQSDLIILTVALDIFMQVKIHIPFCLLSVFYLMCAQAHAHTWSQTSNLTDCCNSVFVVVAVQ